MEYIAKQYEYVARGVRMNKNKMVINILQDNSNPLPLHLNTVSADFKQGVRDLPNGCDYHQILFVISGEGTLNYKNKKFILKKGCAFYTAPETPVSYKGTDNLIVAFLTVKGSAIYQLANHFKCKGFLYYSSIDTRKYLIDINSIITEYYTYKREGVMSALSYSFYINFFEQHPEKLNIINKVALYIDKNFTQKIALKSIASDFGISVSKLCHDFKKEFNRTVFDYILDLRLTYARNIFLTNNDAKTKEVAITCGFDDISYFCKAYKTKFGVSPSDDKNTITK